MGYIVDYGAMQSTLGAFNTETSIWDDGITSVMNAKAAIEASKNISGNSADRMKQYLNTAYSCAISSLYVLIALFRQNFLLYIDAYYNQIDSSRDTRIDEMELSELRSALQGKRYQMQQISLEAEQSVLGISDLVSITNLDISEPDEELGKILTSLDDLDSSINGLESAHVSADFADIDELITQLAAYFQELLALSKDSKTSFTNESFCLLASVPALISTFNKASAQLNAQKSEVELATAALEKRLEEEQAELAKRKEEAEWAKIGVGIAVGVISAAVLVTTGPVGAIVVGTISGAVKSAFNATADEYVKNGWEMDDWNTGRITMQGCLGGFTGLIGSVIPGTGTLAKAGVSALTSAIEGAATASYDQIAASGSITDVKAIGRDVLIKSGSSFAGSLVGSEVSEKMSSFVKTNSTIKNYAENFVGGTKHFGAVLAVEGASGLVSGDAKRVTSTAVEELGGFVCSLTEGKSIIEAYDEHNIVLESLKEAVDVKGAVKDFGGAVTKAAFDDPFIASQRKLEGRGNDYYLFGDSPDLNGEKNGWKDWNSEEYDRMMDSLAGMEARGDDAQNYQLFGDPRTINSQRQAAVSDAWEQERLLVMQGRGTREWSVSQQEELLRTGKVSGFDGSHMLDVSNNNSLASNPDNIQFLTYEEHIQGAHGNNTRNPTSGMFNPATGETEKINPGQLPHRGEVAFELKDKFDYTQADLAEQLGSAFGYDRGNKK